MRLRVVAVGKLKDAALEGLCERYVRRLRPFHRTEVVEVRNLAALRDAWSRTPGPHVLLDERGEQLTSRDLAALVGDARDLGRPQLSLYIGAAEGFTPQDRAGADRLLALSRLTLPHRLARLLLLEQLYRAATILAGHPYHND
ncbi:MAG: 23S rRNA (pseudouridine(1915)-N(3))-methyltransferase RlmH [Nannocystaceae bacterium]